MIWTGRPRVAGALQRTLGEGRVWARAFLAVAATEIRLDAFGSGRVLADLRRSIPGMRRTHSAEYARRVGRAVRIADTVLPGRPSCLRRSIAAYRLLQRDPRARFCLGARTGKGGIDGHSWVRLGRTEVVPAADFGRVRPLVVIRPT